MIEPIWVIERTNIETPMPLYFAGKVFSPNYMDAIRFARQQDAEKLAAATLLEYMTYKVTKHEWS